MPEPPPATLAGAPRPYNHRRLIETLMAKSMELFIQLLKDKTSDVSDRMYHANEVCYEVLHNLISFKALSKSLEDYLFCNILTIENGSFRFNQQTLALLAHTFICQVDLSGYQSRTKVHKVFVEHDSDKVKSVCARCTSIKERIETLPSVFHIEILLMSFHLSPEEEKAVHAHFIFSSIKTVERPLSNGYNSTQLSCRALLVSRLVLILRHTILYPNVCPPTLLLELKSKLKEAPLVRSALTGNVSNRTFLASTSVENMKQIFTIEGEVSSSFLNQLTDGTLFTTSSCKEDTAVDCLGLSWAAELCSSFSWILEFWRGKRALVMEDLVLDPFIILETSVFVSGWNSSCQMEIIPDVLSCQEYAGDITSEGDRKYFSAHEVCYKEAKKGVISYCNLYGQCDAMYGSPSDGLKKLQYRMLGAGGSKKRQEESEHAYEEDEPTTGKKPRIEVRTLQPIEQDQLSNLFPNSELRNLPRTIRGRLLERIARTRLILQHIDGDGNCQFRSVSKVLKGTQEHHTAVRAKVVKEMTKNPKVYMDYGSSLKVPGWKMWDRSYYDNYVRQMTEDREWGDFITLFAAANVWHVRVILFCSYTDNAVKEFVPINCRIYKDVYLAYTYYSSEDAHYDALMLPEDVHALEPALTPERTPRRPIHVEYKVIVKNISYGATSDQLGDLFFRFGRVLDARVIYHRDGHSRGYGFVVLEDEQMMETAIASLNGQLWQQRKIEVIKAMDNHYDLEAYAGV